MTAFNEKYLPVLYILMRSDLESLNKGKAVAQGSHASTMFALRSSKLLNSESPMHADIALKIAQWEGGRGFGTVITKDCRDAKHIQGIVDVMKQTPVAFAMSDVMVDPSYPLLDGKFVHEIPLLTCGYVFGYREDLMPILRQFELYP